MHSSTGILPENGLLDWEVASRKFGKVQEIASLGKIEQLQQGGSLLFLDEAGVFIDGKPSANLQEAIDQLREHGVDVVILTTNNPDNLEDTADIRNQMTLTNGLGSYGDGTLAPRAIVCIFNTHTTDPEYPREVICATGSSLEAVIDEEKAVDFIIDGVLAGDVDAGFTNAYSHFDLELDTAKRELEIRATQQAAPRPTSAPVSYEDRDQAPVMVQPSHPEVSFYN